MIADRLARQAMRAEPGPLQALVLRALDAAHSAGAQYADVRITRSVGHEYEWQSLAHRFAAETETQGIGVRVLADGYWGFTASAVYNPDSVARLAQDAVAQARINASISRAGGTVSNAATAAVTLAPTPPVTGSWSTPIKIDPFTIPVEEKLDNIASWDSLAMKYLMKFPDVMGSFLRFVRQECVLGTTEGSLVTQTTYRTGGQASLIGPYGGPTLQHLGFAARGWDLISEADIPAQIEAIVTGPRRGPIAVKPVQVGRYTVVCSGEVMTALLDQTIGVATQLDRALGYEANASGTSYLDDPLGMLGTLQVASPLVTVTANRSVPTQLATVKWDAEGVAPEEVTLVKDGVLMDYQTTREQAPWIARYYERSGKPIRSHGYAEAESSLLTPLQMSPNLTLTPSTSDVRLEDLTANVSNGILFVAGSVETDVQARSGLIIARIRGDMREIKNGRVGDAVINGAVQFNADIWKKLRAVGGASTVTSMGIDHSAFIRGGQGSSEGGDKGEPAQFTAYTVQAPAALIEDQAIINIMPKGR